MSTQSNQETGKTLSQRTARLFNVIIASHEPDEETADRYLDLTSIHGLGTVVFSPDSPLPIYRDETDWFLIGQDTIKRSTIYQVMDDLTAWSMPTPSGAPAQPTNNPELDRKLHSIAMHNIRKRRLRKSLAVEAIAQATDKRLLRWDIHPPTRRLRTFTRNHLLELMPIDSGHLLRITAADEDLHPAFTLYARSPLVPETDGLYRQVHEQAQEDRDFLRKLLRQLTQGTRLPNFPDDPLMDHLIMALARDTRQNNRAWQHQNEDPHTLHTAFLDDETSVQLLETRNMGQNASPNLLLIVNLRGKPITINAHLPEEDEPFPLPILLSAIHEAARDRAVAALALPQDGSQPLREDRLADFMALLL